MGEIKVLFPFTSVGVGGSQISTFLLARSLQNDHGVEVAVVAAPGSSVADHAARYGLRVIKDVSQGARRRELIRDVTRIQGRRGLLRSFMPSLMHFSDMWSFQAWGLVAQSYSIPSIYHHRSFLKDSFINRFQLRRAKAIISISDACTRNLAGLSRVVPTKIYDPFELSTTSRSNIPLRREPGFFPDPKLKVVGFVANFQRRKRASFFVEAAASIARERPDTRFAVVGRDRDETAETLTALAHDLGILNKIIFAGFRADIDAEIRAMDLLTVPALDEPFGRTPIEAILAGTPYLATDDAGHHEIFHRWGGGHLSSRKASPQDFGRDVVETLSRARESFKLHEAKERITSDLSPKVHAEQVMRVYEQVLRRHK